MLAGQENTALSEFSSAPKAGGHARIALTGAGIHGLRFSQRDDSGSHLGGFSRCGAAVKNVTVALRIDDSAVPPDPPGFEPDSRPIGRQLARVSSGILARLGARARQRQLRPLSDYPLQGYQISFAGY